MNTRARLALGALVTLASLIPGLAEECPGRTVDLQPLPTTMTFSGWVDLADSYQADWERAASGLTADQESAAIRLANELFGGALGGYWLRWDGMSEVSGEHFDARRRVQRAPEEVVEPARSYLLWHIAAIRAEDAPNRVPEGRVEMGLIRPIRRPVRQS